MCYPFEMTQVQFLGDSHFDSDSAGKKASPLHVLTQMGVPVPPGFTLKEAQSVMKDSILAAVQKIGGYPVAVRSSSNLEDLGNASFAGLYDTFLNIESDEALFSSIQKCFESGRGERVLAYLKNKKISGVALEVSVFIQKMVPAKNSGVLFTLHPTLGKEEEAYVEACTGYGEKLVSGHVNPSRYRLDFETGAILEEEIDQEGKCVSENLAKELVSFGLQIMAHFGTPQDIEWSTDQSGKLWILQSRPITQIQWRNDVEEYTNADFKDGGVSASVCTPFMYSLYEAAMQKSMQAYMQTIKLLKKNAEQKTWIRPFYGRAYWNASEVKRRLFKVPGFDEESFDLDLGIQKNYGAKGPHRVPTNLWTILPVIPVALALGKEYQQQLVRTENYQKLFYLPEENKLWQALATASDDALFKLAIQILDFQLKTECDYFTTIYDNTNLQGDFKKFLRDQEKKYGFQADIAKLFSGVDGISHLEVQVNLIKLVETARSEGFESSVYQNARTRFLKDFGFHADRELDLLCPRWSEVPELINSRVKDLLKSQSRLVDPAESQKTQHQQFEQEKDRLSALILGSGARKKFLKELTRIRVYLRRREEMREVSTKAYALTRALTLKLGQELEKKKKIESSRDLFFVNRDEVLLLAQTSSHFDFAKLRSKISFRKKMYEGYRFLTPPNELGFGTTAIETGEWSSENTGAQTLKGLGCSPGIVRGTVRVVHLLDEAYQLKEGEILVTRFTDPGWTAVLGMVKGVITEVGGMLSHAAVIGRELGVPAILNLPQVTKLLKTGDQIEMNGSTGEIRVVSE